jgi:hypothetical protein
VLQDAGLWRYAATLAAGSLPASAQAAVLDRWSAHIAQVCAALDNAFLLATLWAASSGCDLCLCSLARRQKGTYGVQLPCWLPEATLTAQQHSSQRPSYQIVHQHLLMCWAMQDLLHCSSQRRLRRTCGCMQLSCCRLFKVAACISAIRACDLPSFQEPLVKL